MKGGKIGSHREGVENGEEIECTLILCAQSAAANEFVEKSNVRFYIGSFIQEQPPCLVDDCLVWRSKETIGREMGESEKRKQRTCKEGMEKNGKETNEDRV